MKKINLIFFLLLGVGIFANNNYESGNFYYEESFKSNGIDTLSTDLSTEEFKVFYHRENRIDIVITGDAPSDNIDNYLNIGTDQHSFYIETKYRGINIFDDYDLNIEVILPENQFNIFEIKSSTGDVTIDEKTFLHELRIESSTGDILLESIDAKEVVLISTTGEKEVGEIICDNAIIKSSTGENRFGDFFCKTGSIKGSTSDLYINNALGNLNVSTSTGRVEIVNSENGNIDIRTSTGDVILGLSQKSGYSLNLSTSTGDIETEMPIEVVGPFEKNELKGTIKGGEYKVYVNTSTGDISIQ